MCYPVNCETCGKTTWNGCGQHVDEVRRAVPAAQWCGGHEASAQPAPSTGLLGRIFGR